MHHHLKIQEKYMMRRLNGEKPFEVRINDRDFQVGDTVSFEIIDPTSAEYYPNYKITYIHSGLGLIENYVVMTLEPINDK